MIYSANPQPVNVHSFSTEAPEVNPDLKRVTSTVEYKNDRFIVKDRSFNRQFAHLYAERLMTMRKRLTAAATEKWGKVDC